MAVTPLASPQALTFTADGTWNDVDVTAYVSNASGVMLRAYHNNASASKTIGFRKNGSTDTYLHEILDNGQAFLSIGIDGSDIFEVNADSGDTWTLELHGYYNADDVVFFDNAVVDSNSTADEWQDIDISADTGADTAIAAIVNVRNAHTAETEMSLRPNGSTFNFAQKLYQGTWGGSAVIGVDGSEIFEAWTGNLSADPFLTVGYFKSNITTVTNGTDVTQTGTAAYADLNNMPATVIVGFFNAFNTATSFTDFGIRPDGVTAYDNLGEQADNTTWCAMGAVSNVIEANRANADTDVFLFAYTTALPSGGGSSVPAIQSNYMRRRQGI